MKKFIKKLKRSFEYHNPFNTWWSVRKYFKRPRIKIIFGDRFDGLPYGWVREPWWKILNIYSYDLTWKDKSIHPEDKDPRFEESPQINIVFFSRWQILIKLVPVSDVQQFGIDDIYWETILSYKYYNLNLYESVQNNIWKTMNDDNYNHDVTVLTLNLLTEEGIKEYNKGFCDIKN